MTDATAALSDCGAYRYHLRRAALLRGAVASRVCLFVMLNPSTADGERDDPTIRRCRAFARAWGYGVLEVVNLFALRSSNPSPLALHIDPVGPKNDAWLAAAAQRAGLICAAWGCPNTTAVRSLVRLRTQALPHDLTRHVVHILGKTADGSPRHPLFAPSDAQPVQWAWPWRAPS